MIHGYDVSVYQPEHPNVSGQQFLFVKATEGTSYTNPRMAGQAQTARTAGIALGFYHYPNIAGDPVAQAKHFLSQTRLLGGEILILDWEWYGQHVTNQKARAYKDAWLAYVKGAAHGHKVILYTDTSNWLNVDQNGNCADGLWIADYSHPAGQPPIQHPWLFHQYTDKPLDQSVGRFASLDELKAWAGQPAADGAVGPVTPTPAGVPDWVRLTDHVMSIEEKIYEGWNSNGGWNNLTPFGEEFGENGVAWCVIFEWDMYHDVGLASIVKKTDNVQDFTDWARSKGYWSLYPSVGAWVNLGNGEHTEIVVGFDAQNVYTKGGNSLPPGQNGQGNGVWSHTFRRSDPYVVGYFAPRFPDGVCPPTADPRDPRGGREMPLWRWNGYSTPTRPVPTGSLRQKEDAMGVAVVPLKTGFGEATVVPVPRVWVGDPDIPVGRVWLSLASDFGKVNLRVALFKPDRGWRVLDSVVVDNSADAVRIDPWEGESKLSVVRKPLTDGDTADSTPCGVMVESVLR
ncbi:GH25 family lysozyme [Kitasatospora sp. NPDC085879]|uniref:GH25 family lysozyme n=1 Tax=Kitasatospora sp. NPDC085879 TaxID=3154769 RepID=UPI00341E5EC9